MHHFSSELFSRVSSVYYSYFCVSTHASSLVQHSCVCFRYSELTCGTNHHFSTQFFKMHFKIVILIWTKCETTTFFLTGLLVLISSYSLTLQVAMPALPPPPIQSINLLSLHYKVTLCALACVIIIYYLQVPWPLDVIFSDPLMEVYNKIFRFLLQVKFAKWSLDEICVGGERVDSKEKSGCLNILVMLPISSLLMMSFHHTSQ